MAIPRRFNCHLLRNLRFHHRHITMLTTTTMVMTLTAMMLVVVLGDYPPPSEDSLGHYSSSRNNRGGAGGGGVGYISDWNGEWENLGNPNPGKCIDIPPSLTLCGNIGYRKMRLPNLLEHDNLKEVSQQAVSWVRLLGLRCHPDTQIFLCSLFAPVCLERPIWPCRSLCESVKAGCESRMLTYGFPWPDMLRCGQFPADDDLCIGMRNESQKERESSCSACLSDTFESTVDHYCRAEFVMRVKVKQAIVTGTDMKIDTDKKKKLIKTGPLRSNELLRDSSLFLAQGSSCECSALDGVGSSGTGRNASSFIVMGRVADGDRLVLSFVHRLDVDEQSKDVNRALRVVRRSDVCTKSAAVLEAEQSGVAGSSSSSETKKGGGGGGRGTKSSGKKKKAKGKKSTPPPTGKEARIKRATTTAEWKSTTTPKTPTVTRRKAQQSGKTADTKQQQQQQQQQQKKKAAAATVDPKRFY